jgi:membrane fusion protein, multidrug efflux system
MTGPAPDPTRMSKSISSRLVRLTAGLLLIAAVVGAGLALRAWKARNAEAAAAAAAGQPEPAEVVEVGKAALRPYARSTTAIGTARALESITLRIELPGTVAAVPLTTGALVEPGQVLLELDTSVERAELAALAAEARLAAALLERIEKALATQSASAADVDRARAQRDQAVANVARVEAVIERKRLRAPFQARAGIVDVHQGQYLDAGAVVTTLQGTAPAVHVDFAVPQEVAALLAPGAPLAPGFTVDVEGHAAEVVAVDAQVDPRTRNRAVRALLRGERAPAPGSSLRVRVPVEAPRDVVVVPADALRRGPSGDHVFVIAAAEAGAQRATTRPVRVGGSIGDFVIVASGLEAGETVATAGSFKLREGALVVVAPSQPQPTAVKPKEEQKQ